MQISHNGIVFIEDAEGFRSTAYKDGGGVWTIGFGTTFIDGQPVEEGMTCTVQQAEVYMQGHLASVQTAVNQLVRVPMKQGMFDALCSFVYNLGVKAFRESTMLTLLNKGQYKEAGAQFDKWVYDNGKVVPGLISRRRRERDMFDK